MRRRAAALVGLGVTLFILSLVSTRADAEPTPTATADPSVMSLGQRVLVQGENWSPRSQVHLELCGNQALDLSADCDLRNGINAGVGSDGRFSMLLTIGDPGKPCPCVIRVTSADGGGDARIAVDVVDLPKQAPTATPLQGIADVLQVTDVRVQESDSWTAWFGAPTDRTLSFNVRNTGEAVLRDPVLSIAFGKGDDPTGFVATPKIGDLQPGELRTVRATLHLHGLSWGTYTVRGRIGSVGQPVVFGTRTSIHPWGAVVVALVLLQLVLLAIRNLVRRRLYRDSEDAAADELVVADAGGAIDVTDGPVPVPAIDLTAEPIASLAQTVQTSATAMIAAVEARSDRMRLTAEGLELAASGAVERTTRDADACRRIMAERVAIAQVDIERARSDPLSAIRLADEHAERLIADAERRARGLVERARDDALALLLPATPEKFDGTLPLPAIVLPDDLRQMWSDSP